MTEPDFTASRGRKFAFTLAAAFAIVAAIALWRQRPAAAAVAGSVAMVMFLLGLAIPQELEPVERLWMKLAHLISRVTTPVFMGIVYFLVLTPVGVVRRLAGTNPLVHRLNNGTYWIRRTSRQEEKARLQMERQF
jgi:hypothetical protein